VTECHNLGPTTWISLLEPAPSPRELVGDLPKEGLVRRVPAALLTEPQVEIEAARERTQEEGHAEAVRDIAEVLEIPSEDTERGLRTLETLPTVTREFLMRQIAEVWPERRRASLSNGGSWER
jgi:hypothetical protein